MRSRGMEKGQQQHFGFVDELGHGGARKGAGRKRGKAVAHGSRESVCKSYPRLVTLKFQKGTPILRSWDGGAVITEAIAKAHREGFRVIHFSIQVDHVHLLVEAHGKQELARGMQGLTCRIARGLNKRWGTRGSMFAGRFHDVVLRSMRAVYNALRYVLCNHNRHGVFLSRVEPDIFSSGHDFDGWSDHAWDGEPPRWTRKPGWLIRNAVERYGRFPVSYTPRPIPLAA